MSLTLRPSKPEDAAMCGVICYEAFKTIAEQHNFPSNYPSPEVAVARMEERLSHPWLCHRHQCGGACGGGDDGSRASAHWGGTNV